jgi:RHS repeat-associated protein
MIVEKKQSNVKLRRALLRWLALGLLFAGTHAFAQSTGTVTYVYTDPQGTPLAETDASGNITATFDYTPYGTYAPNGTSTPGPNPNGPGYTGHVNDPETNLVYMQARYYDPATGQFLSTDPMSPTEGDTFNFNRYAYASNNPVLNIDPTGRASQPPAWYTRALASIEKVLNSPAAQKAEAQIGAGMLAGSEGEMEGGAAPIVDEAADSALNAQLNQESDPNRPYSNLQDSKFVGAGKAITAAQKAKTAAQNMLRNGGQLKSDEDGTPLVPGQQSQSGVTPPDNEVAFDHYDPRNPTDPNTPRGSNSYSNIRIISRAQNNAKSNTPPQPPTPALHSLNQTN